MNHLQDKYTTGEFSQFSDQNLSFDLTKTDQSNDENLAPTLVTSEQPPLKKVCRRNKGNEMYMITATMCACIYVNEMFTYYACTVESLIRTSVIRTRRLTECAVWATPPCCIHHVDIFGAL